MIAAGFQIRRSFYAEWLWDLIPRKKNVAAFAGLLTTLFFQSAAITLEMGGMFPNAEGRPPFLGCDSFPSLLLSQQYGLT